MTKADDQHKLMNIETCSFTSIAKHAAFVPREGQ